MIRLCLLLGVLSVAAASAPAGDSLSKPNIIFVVADDMGFKDTGYSGNSIAKTPHLDRMAAECLRFNYFYSAAGTCSPGRMLKDVAVWQESVKASFAGKDYIR
jgi:hypothetical protein